MFVIALYYQQIRTSYFMAFLSKQDIAMKGGASKFFQPGPLRIINNFIPGGQYNYL